MLFRLPISVLGASMAKLTKLVKDFKTAFSTGEWECSFQTIEKGKKI